MKVRTGFVSNSSSSSFIVLLPKSLKEFKMEDLTEDCKNNLLEHYQDDPDDSEERIYEQGLECINTALAQLKRGDTVYKEDDNCGAYECLEELLSPYVIASCDSAGGDGAGTIEPADMKAVKKILKDE